MCHSEQPHNGHKNYPQTVREKIGNQGENESLRTMTRFYVKIPLSSVHLYHPLGAAAMIGQYVEKRVVQKVYDLVKLSITNVGEVKRGLDQFVGVRSSVTFQIPKSQERRIGDTIPVAKIFVITLHRRFLR